MMYRMDGAVGGRYSVYITLLALAVAPALKELVAAEGVGKSVWNRAEVEFEEVKVASTPVAQLYRFRSCCLSGSRRTVTNLYLRY